MVSFENTLSKFGTRINGKDERVKFTHLQTRYRVLFRGFGQSCYAHNNNIDNVYNADIGNPYFDMSPKGIDSKDISMDMTEFPIPQGNFKREAIENVNGPIYYPGKWEWQELTFKVYNSYDNMNYRILMSQIQHQRDLYTQNTGTVPENYKFLTIFEHTDGHQNAVAFWVMEGCFLEEAHPEQGGKNGDHSATIISCKMSFDNATLYDYDGNRITDHSAGTSHMMNDLANGGGGELSVGAKDNSLTLP